MEIARSGEELLRICQEENISLSEYAIRYEMEDKGISTANRNKEIISRLYKKGVYNMKDAVSRTAEILGISKNTVYLHLRNLEQE